MWFWVSNALSNGLDADGAGIPVQAPGSSGLVQQAPRLAPRRIALGLRLGLEGDALSRTADGLEQELVGYAAMGRLEAAGMLTRSLGATLQVPVRFAATSDLDGVGSAFGDVRATVWGRAPLGPLSGAAGLQLRLPTGSPDVYSGTGRAVPTLHAGLTWEGPVTLLGALSISHEGEVEAVDALGGPVLASALGARLAEGPVEVGLSLRDQLPLAEAIRTRRGRASEFAIDGSLSLTDRLTGSVLASAGLTKGVGAPALRIEVGFVAVLGAEPPPPPIVYDAIEVVDPDGTPVAAAAIRLPDGRELRADAYGKARWEELPGRLVVRGNGLGEVETRGRGTIVLPWRPVPVKVRVSTATGESAAAGVTLDGDTQASLVEAGGVWEFEIPPGTWKIAIEAEGYGRQERQVDVAPRRTRPVDLDVVLLPTAGEASLDVRVVDPEDRGISGAEVRLDGVSIGTMGEGEATIGGLLGKQIQVQVDSRYFAEGAAEVDLSSGRGAAGFGLYYAPGTVRVVATGPSGPIADGMVFVEGPRTLPPVELGENGERLLELGDGDWTLVLSSPAHGLQERGVVVEPDGPVPLEARFELLSETAGKADLILELRDVEGEPLEGIFVFLGGEPVGRTGTGGWLRLDGLPAGPIRLDARGDGLVPVEREIELVDGPQVVNLGLGWDDGALRVAARSGREPLDARVDFAGPTPYDGGQLGPPGRRLFTELPVGDWEIVATHELGMEVAWTTLGGRDGRLADVTVHLGEESGDGALDLTVVDPEGQPVAGADVRLDGSRMVETASGGRVRVGNLREGVRQLEIRHPWFEPAVLPLELTPTTLVRQELSWREGLVDLVVTAGGEPVTDGLAYFEGPQSLEPVALGADGRAVVAVGPGEWEVLVSSGRHGLASRAIAIENGRRAPERVTVDLVREPGVLVSVVDRRGRPVVGAVVAEEGGVSVETGLAGTAFFPFESDAATVSVRHPGILEVPPVELLASQPERRVEIGWAPRQVTVRVQSEGEPVQALISATGPERVDKVVALGGQGSIALPVGRWELVASASDEGLGALRRFVEVPPVGGVPEVLFELVPARVRQTAEGLELVDVKFAPGADIADAAFAPVLEEIAATVIGDPRIREVEVQGHTDPTGGMAFNFDLSRRRALSIVERLVELGVPPDLLIARGYGPSRPVADNDTPEGRAKNRRVDFQTVLSDAR